MDAKTEKEAVDACIEAALQILENEAADEAKNRSPGFAQDIRTAVAELATLRTRLEEARREIWRLEAEVQYWQHESGFTGGVNLSPTTESNR